MVGEDPDDNARVLRVIAEGDAAGREAMTRLLPLLGPERDRRNEPANLTFARDFIAEAHGVSPDRVDEVTTANAKRLFPLLTSSRG